MMKSVILILKTQKAAALMQSARVTLQVRGFSQLSSATAVPPCPGGEGPSAPRFLSGTSLTWHPFAVPPLMACVRVFSGDAQK